MRINARLYIVTTLLLVVIFNISGRLYAQVNFPDANVPTTPQASTYREDLASDLYKQTLECYRREMDSYRREMDNFKWVITIALTSIGIIVAIGGILITYISKSHVKESKLAAKESKFGELWSKANFAYITKDYETSAKTLEKIHKDYKIENRPFFNNWGSSLLHWAEQETGRKKEQLLNQAIEKYLRAESYTEGTASYNIACCYAMIDNKEDVRKWLETAKKTGRLLSWQRASTDTHLQKYAGENWFRKIWDQS